MTPFIVDGDRSIEYETNGSLKKFIDILFIPILNSIPSRFRDYVKMSNRSAKKVIETATTHEAIEILYLNGARTPDKTLLQKLFFKIWSNTNNPRAVRNRLRAVKREIRHAAKGLTSDKHNINLLSIASGSARGILEALASQITEYDVAVTFLDKNSNALKYSKKLNSEFFFPDNYSFAWIEDKANNIEKYFHDDKPNIVEMVGLMDYFLDDQVVRIFKTIYTIMQEGGTFITANITDNAERSFITNVIGWEMIYRDPAQFNSFALQAGFQQDKIRIFYEPLKVHFVMVCVK